MVERARKSRPARPHICQCVCVSERERDREGRGGGRRRRRDAMESPMSKMWREVRHLFGQKYMRVLILGLDNAGKTTILYKLQTTSQQIGEIKTTRPAFGFMVKHITYKNLKFQVWDLGGQHDTRRYWKYYYTNADAIIYVVDSTDTDRMLICRNELQTLLEEKQLRDSFLLVLCNKQDLTGAMSVDDIQEALGLNSLRKPRMFRMQSASAQRGDGLHEGMQWLAAALHRSSRGRPVLGYTPSKLSVKTGSVSAPTGLATLAEDKKDEREAMDMEQVSM